MTSTRATITPAYASVIERSLARWTRGIAAEIPHSLIAGSTTHPSQTTAKHHDDQTLRGRLAPATEIPAMQTRTMVASTTSADADTDQRRAAASSRHGNRRTPSRRRETESATRSLVQVGPFTGQHGGGDRDPHPHSSTIDSARNARVRSRWRSHPLTVNAPRRMQAPPKAHDSAGVAVLKAPCSIGPDPRIPPTSPFCEVRKPRESVSVRLRSAMTPSPRSPHRRPGRCRRRWGRRAPVSCRR